MKIEKIDINKIRKVKPGNLRVTVVDNRFYNDAPYVNAKTQLPQWFRRVHKGEGSVRSCSGISDFLEFGITIPAWTTFKFVPNVARGVWEIRADQFNPPIDYQMASGFHFEQTGSCPMTEARKIEKMSYPKLITPWRIQTAPGWSSMFLPVLYEEQTEYSVLPSIVNTDYYQMANIVLNIKTDSEFTIKQGTPLAHVIPIERKNDIRHIDYVDESFFRYASSSMYLTGGVVPSSGTGIAYRKAAKVVDASLEKKSKWWRPKNQ